MSMADNRILSFIDTTEKPMYFASNGRPIYRTYYATFDGERRYAGPMKKGDEIRVIEKATGDRKYGIVQSVKPHCPVGIHQVPYRVWSVKLNKYESAYVQCEELADGTIRPAPFLAGLRWKQCPLFDCPKINEVIHARPSCSSVLNTVVQAKEAEAVQDIMSRNASLTMENWRLKDTLKAVRALSDKETEKDGNIRAIVDSALTRIDSAYSETRTYTIENLRHAPFYMMEQRTQEMLKALKELEEQE